MSVLKLCAALLPMHSLAESKRALQMYRLIRADKIHISLIVAAINDNCSDCALYHKHKYTIDGIEDDLGRWYCVSDNSKMPIAFIRIDDINLTNGVLRYTIIASCNDIFKNVLIDVVRSLFKMFSCNKLVTDIMYDRSEAIKQYISLGSSIEVRKRQHLYTDGRYIHVVEVATWRSGVLDERIIC